MFYLHRSIQIQSKTNNNDNTTDFIPDDIVFCKQTVSNQWLDFLLLSDGDKISLKLYQHKQWKSLLICDLWRPLKMYESTRTWNPQMSSINVVSIRFDWMPLKPKCIVTKPFDSKKCLFASDRHVKLVPSFRHNSHDIRKLLEDCNKKGKCAISNKLPLLLR